MKLVAAVLCVLLVGGCSGAAPTPQIIYVTPAPTAVAVTSMPVAPTPVASTPGDAQAPTGTGMAGGICYLVTNDEIAAAMGRPPLAGGGSGFELGGLRSCNWITYMDPVEGAGLELSSAANHETERILSPETVPGLGDDAYWLPSFGSLEVKVGPYNLTVSVTSTRVDQKAAAIQIAKAALSRLR